MITPCLHSLVVASVRPLSAPAEVQIQQESVPIAPAAGPGIRDRRDRNLGAEDDFKAAVAGDTADAEYLGSMLRIGIDAYQALRGLEGLVSNGLADSGHVIGAGFLDGLGQRCTPK